MNWEKHIIDSTKSIKESMICLDKLGLDAIMFVQDEQKKLVGSITDGDIRRGLLNGAILKDPVIKICNNQPEYVVYGEQYVIKLKEQREKNLKIVPIVTSNNEIVDIVNFRISKSRLPVDVVLMAGGKGTRLLPLTENTPKPLLKLNGKPVLEINIDRLISFGIKNVFISVNYLGEQIKEYLGDGKSKGINIKYINEVKPLGTIGSLRLIDDLQNDHLLIMNSDLLTSIDFEDFFIDYINNNRQMSIVGIPYQVKIPYGILESENKKLSAFKEKPTYTFYANGGIYLLNKNNVKWIPENSFFNATDLVEKMIEMNLDVRTFQLLDYWMDIGNHSDYKKAQTDIKKMKLQ